MNIIFGNFGDNTIALIQWAFEKGLQNVRVVHINTQWAAQTWGQRVAEGSAFAEQCGFESVELSSSTTFTEMVLGRENFPNQKFQWCAGFLKGLAFMMWADQLDPEAEAVVLLGSRRTDSRIREGLEEFKERSEHFGKRRVWYPLYQHSNFERDELIQRAGFSVLNHRSLECDPCIHSQIVDFQQMSSVDIEKVKRIENQLQKPMFHPMDVGGAQNIEQVISWAKQQPASDEANSLEFFNMGCGALYSCGE